jgi:hypothetical protein
MTSVNTTRETIEDRGVRYFDTLKGVSNAEATAKLEVAGGTLVTIKHQKDGKDAWAWYFEDSKTQVALKNTLETAGFIEGRLKPLSFTRLISETTFPELVKLGVMSVLAIVFAFATVYLVIKEPDNKSVQLITGLLGLTLGYFLGKIPL